MFFSGTMTVAAQKVLVVLPKDDWTRKQIILVVTKDNIFMYKILPFLLPCIRSIQELIWKNLAILVTSPSVILWCSKTNIRHIRYFVKYTWCICADLFYLLSSIYLVVRPKLGLTPKGLRCVVGTLIRGFLNLIGGCLCVSSRIWNCWNLFPGRQQMLFCTGEMSYPSPQLENIWLTWVRAEICVCVVILIWGFSLKATNARSLHSDILSWPYYIS